MSINVKFLLYLTSGANNRCSILPQLWINSFFKIPNNVINENQQYFYNFFKSNLNILDCILTVPRKNNWKGHPFYYEILKSLEKMTSHVPQELENILSIPIWFNKYLKTKFDSDISRAGFNSIKDLFPCGQMLDVNLNANRPNLRHPKIRKMEKIIENMPGGWKNCIQNAPLNSTVVSPRHVISYMENDYFIQHLGTDRIYQTLISSIKKVPIGVLRWREEQNSQTNITNKKVFKPMPNCILGFEQ